MANANYSAYMEIKRQLLQIFKTETFVNNKLPPEATLAARLGISLVTLREAMLILAIEGYITKRHGAGNFIHPSALDHENRSFYFVDFLKKAGYKVRIRLHAQAQLHADEEVASELRLPVGEPVLRNTIIYYANRQPAIVTYGYIPIAKLVRDDWNNMHFEYVHALVREFMNRELAHSLNEYCPYALSEELAAIFDLPVGTPIVGSKQAFYDVQDDTVLYNHHYFYPNIYKVRTLQNWDLGR
ncbi:MAG: GntR family transcriptional regulator [Christensenellaceae bacterium]|jgi:GntR family transcriptional regulator|nr:GntR family transcriptional regulator [Christensenellaceae bacterium]